MFNELYTVTQYSLKIVASYSPVRLMYENKQSKQFIDSAAYNPVRLWSVKYSNEKIRQQKRCRQNKTKKSNQNKNKEENK